MEGNKAKAAADALVKLKEDEIIAYAEFHKEIIYPFLKLQKELDQLRSNAVDVRMKQLPFILQSKNKSKLF